jgi:hypothetical protein
MTRSDGENAPLEGQGTAVRSEALASNRRPVLPEGSLSDHPGASPAAVNQGIF